MSNQVLSDGAVVYYAVSLQGRIVSGKFTDRVAAEQAKQGLIGLSSQQKSLAEVVVVDQNNNQLLLG